jgi:hypothetical protein
MIQITKHTDKGRKIRPVVDNLLAMTGIDLTDGGVPELIKFQEHFRVQNCRFRRIELQRFSL